MNPPDNLPPPYVVVNLRSLKFIKCDDKDAMQDAIRAMRVRGIRYIATKWCQDDGNYIPMETHE